MSPKKFFKIFRNIFCGVKRRTVSFFFPRLENVELPPFSLPAPHKNCTQLSHFIFGGGSPGEPPNGRSSTVPSIFWGVYTFALKGVQQ